jgi:hypothetical protein
MTVEEMNILTTIFLRYDNEKIYYPNSVLSTKPTNNFYRSPEMSDSIEFAVDVSTSIESIKALKSRIKTYVNFPWFFIISCQYMKIKCQHLLASHDHDCFLYLCCGFSNLWK